MTVTEEQYISIFFQFHKIGIKTPKVSECTDNAIGATCSYEWQIGHNRKLIYHLSPLIEVGLPAILEISV